MRVCRRVARVHRTEGRLSVLGVGVWSRHILVGTWVSAWSCLTHGLGRGSDSWDPCPWSGLGSVPGVLTALSHKLLTLSRRLIAMVRGTGGLGLGVGVSWCRLLLAMGPALMVG